MARAALVGIVLSLAACAADPVPRSSATRVPATSSPTPDPCAGYPPPFEATYLPEGFHRELRKGAGLFKGADGAGADYPTEGLVGHYRGEHETIHANFETRPGPLPYEPADPKPLRVLGRPGRIGTIEGGFAVEFVLGDCDFRMDTYGVSRAETVRIAQGLARR
jgi:hypothetical protein